MRVKKAGGRVFGAELTAAERKALNIEINRQIVEADKRYTDDLDAAVLYTLHTHLGFGKKRLRAFYDAFREEHRRMVQQYEMPDDYPWLCKEKLKQIGVDITRWNDECRKGGVCIDGHATICHQRRSVSFVSCENCIASLSRLQTIAR